METTSPIFRAHLHVSCEQDAAALACARVFARVIYAQAVHMRLAFSGPGGELLPFPLTPSSFSPFPLHAATGSQCGPLDSNAQNGARRAPKGGADLLLRPGGRVRVSVWQSMVTEPLFWSRSPYLCATLRFPPALLASEQTSCRTDQLLPTQPLVCSLSRRSGPPPGIGPHVPVRHHRDSSWRGTIRV
jgi:hypothetical protein